MREAAPAAARAAAAVPGPLGQVSLLAGDMGKAEALYRDRLGLPHLFTFGDLAFFGCGGTRLFLRQVPEGRWQPVSILYFAVLAFMPATGILATGEWPSTAPRT